MMEATESNFDDDDTHICLKCQITIIGLENYILHRRSKCTSLNLEAPTISKSVEAQRCGAGPSVENHGENPLPSALDFFSSLELMSKAHQDDFDIDFDIPTLPKSGLELSSKGPSFLRIADLELEPNFNLDIGDIGKVRRGNYDALADLNLIQEDSIMGMDRSRSILDSDIFSSAPLEKTLSPMPPPDHISILPSNRTEPPPFQTSGKWMPGKSDHLKSGSNIHYFCRTCNRRLSSRISYEKHLRSELHFKRKTESSLYEMEDELPAMGVRQRRCNKRYVDAESVNKTENVKAGKVQLVDKIPGPNKKYTSCEICNIKVPNLLFGKHLLSHYHYIKGCQNPLLAKELVLNNIEKIVKHFSFQCQLCHFYCNMTEDFLCHFGSEQHNKKHQKTLGFFYCQPCKFEETALHSIDVHLISDEHLQVVAALNQSVPIVIKKRTYCFQCQVCRVKFQLNIQLKQHLLKSHGISSKSLPTFSCKICKFSCNKQRSLQRHMISKHRGRNKRKQTLAPTFEYFCGTCEKTFQNKEDAAHHRMQLECRQKSAALKGIDVTKVCKMCHAVFESLVEYKQHVFYAHPGILHTCKNCDKSFAISQDLSRHSRSCKTPAVAQVSNSAHRGKFFCFLCKKTFTRLRNLVYHETHVHENCGKFEQDHRKLLRCELCIYSANTKSKMSNHVLAVHFKNCRTRDWSCEICDKSFYEKSQLKSHKPIHFSKQFKCGISCCKFETASASALNRHTIIYHQSGSYNCNACSQHFGTKFESLLHKKSHIRRHEKEPQEVCSETSTKAEFPVGFTTCEEVKQQHDVVKELDSLLYEVSDVIVIQVSDHKL